MSLSLSPRSSFDSFLSLRKSVNSAVWVLNPFATLCLLSFFLSSYVFFNGIFILEHFCFLLLLSQVCSFLKKKKEHRHCHCSVANSLFNCMRKYICIVYKVLAYFASREKYVINNFCTSFRHFQLLIPISMNKN